MSKNPIGLTIHMSAEGLDEGSDVDLFFFERVNTKEIPFFLSLHQPQTSHEYCRRIFAMLTMSPKDL